MKNLKRTSLVSRAVLVISLTLATICAVAAPSQEEIQSQIRALAWQRGPGVGSLSGKAAIQIPADGAMLAYADSSRFLELLGNLPSTDSNIVIGGNWFAAFSFVDEGYVKDDEKIDAVALMEQMKKNQELSNQERQKRGLPLMYVDGWFVAPHYDKETHRLEWGTKLHTSNSNEPIVNYTVRLLGRGGHESATLVSDPANLDADVKSFKKTLATFNFNAGEKYSEFREGDRVAAYGLGALVVGGAAAVAAKSGFWKVLIGALLAGWKFVAAAVVAVLVGMAKMFGKRSKA